MKGRGNPIANLIMLVTAIVALAVWLAGGAVGAIAIFAFGIYVGLSPRLLKEWERGVLLRLGRFKRVLGPGINWTFPGFDRLVATVDMRIRSTPFQAEKTLTNKASAVYRRDPIALRIRAMNMTYESIKERGALMVVPSDMVGSMGGLAAFAPAAFEQNTPRLPDSAPDEADT